MATQHTADDDNGTDFLSTQNTDADDNGITPIPTSTTQYIVNDTI